MGRKKKRTTAAKPRIAPPVAPAAKPGLGAALAHLRGRMIAGLLLVLPFVVTFWIVYWLYTTLDLYVISPVSQYVVRSEVVRAAAGSRLAVVLDWVAPLVGLALVGVFLYFLGFVARSRVISLFETFLKRVPIVTSIYSAASRMFQALGGTNDMSRFKRVVLVPFPHLGMRVPAFVTSSCRDQQTGQTILCVYVPTTPIPTSGYMLMVPEEEVTDLDWSLEETIQAVVSFGLTAPEEVRYYPTSGASTPPTPRVEEAARKS